MANEPQKREPLVVASKMRGYIRGQGMMSSSEAVGAVSEHVYHMLDTAIARAKANHRSTVKVQDL